MALNYEQDTKIDETALDVEWLEQADLARRYGQYVADLKYEVNKLEEQKKAQRSELIHEANLNPYESTGKKTPNAGDIEAFYRRDPEYQRVVQRLLDKQYELEYAEVAKNEVAFTRKAALENLVRLHGQQYFAGPSVPRDLSKERQNQYQQNAKVKPGRRRTSQ